ncbi:MAG TPA: CHASE domain-containing protein, partial [Candidatus Manganitrophaceae bacterium]|nr:CHASE domain-containing protein [Candidatus Manganitrophaceae bacterium]
MNRPFSPWKRALQEAAASLLILCLTLTLTVIAWRYTAEEIEKETRVHFDSEVRAAKEALNRRLQAYIDALHALQSLFAVRDNVTRAEWRGYIESLDLQKRYPGIYYFAFARYVPKAEKADFERQVRNDASLKKEGYPGFSIKPAGDRAEYFPIDYLEPYSSAWGQFGFDIGSDPVQYAAIERACDTGDPAATGRVVLDATSQPGFSIRLPVYRKGAPHRTVEERRGALLGFVSSAFNMSDLMGGVFGHQVSSDLDFEVYDIEPMANLGGAEPLTEDRLLYDNDTIRHADDPAYHPRYRAVTTLNVAGRAWSLYFSTRPHFGAGPQDRLPRLVLFGGTVISLLLFGMIWSQGTSRRRALDLAGAITADLRKSEEQYRLLFDRNPHPMWVFDRETLAFLAVNEAAVRHYGYSRNEFLAMTIKDIRPAEEIPALLNYKAVAAANPTPSELGRTGVWRHLKKDGTLIDVEIVWSPISFKGRDATLVLVDDVTDRRRAERALSESQRVLSTLMSNLPGMAYRCKNDPEWTIEFVSEGCLDLTGYHPSDLIGNKTLSYATLIHPEDQEPVWDDVQAALSK